ncbi:DNA-binding protein [Desulfolithobacter sp.]
MKYHHRFLCGALMLTLLATPAFAAGTAQDSSVSKTDGVSKTDEANVPAPELGLDGKPIKGKVLETMNAAGYTYINLETPQGKIWIAVPEAKVEVGKEITAMPGMVMANFESKTLGRTFETIVFSSGIGEGDVAFNPHQMGGAGPMMGGTGTGGSDNSFAAALQAETGATNPHANVGMGGDLTMEAAAMAASPGASGAVVPSADVKVEKAQGDNAYTVGEIFAKAKELNNKKVKVRGKVMKVSRAIMGKNWVHLQDGSGSALENSHDLVVTTQADPAIGSVVEAEGTLHADRDFGAGYMYKAIIEDATIK